MALQCISRVSMLPRTGHMDRSHGSRGFIVRVNNQGTMPLGIVLKTSHSEALFSGQLFQKLELLENGATMYNKGTNTKMWGPGPPRPGPPPPGGPPPPWEPPPGGPPPGGPPPPSRPPPPRGPPPGPPPRGPRGPGGPRGPRGPPGRC